MGAITALLMVSTGVWGAGKEDYRAAYDRAKAEGRPLVVLVGAPWCPGCRTMKQVTMPKLQRTGKLEGVIYVEINSDEQPALAGKLMRGNSIPQLVVFYQDDSGWRRSQLTGAHGESQVESLVKRAVTAQSEAKDSEKSREVASGGE